MKSLRYILADRPVTLDDCLDRAGREAVPPRVEITARTEDFIGGPTCACQFVACLTWRFSDATATQERVIGGCPLDAAPARRAIAIARANARLEHLVARLRGRGAAVECSGLETSAFHGIDLPQSNGGQHVTSGSQCGCMRVPHDH